MFIIGNGPRKPAECATSVGLGSDVGKQNGGAYVVRALPRYVAGPRTPHSVLVHHLSHARRAWSPPEGLLRQFLPCSRMHAPPAAGVAPDAAAILPPLLHPLPVAVAHRRVSFLLRL